MNNLISKGDYPNGAPRGVVPFNFGTQAVRAMLLDGEPWFVLADVCAVLGIQNSGNASARLDEDEKGVQSMDTPGGKQNLTVINESGLYSVILSSNKPEAKRFKKWVTAEVLPQIRKTGSYGQAPAVDEIKALNDPATLRNLLGGYAERVIALEDKVAEQAPVVAAYDRISRAHGLLNLTEAAKLLGQQPKKFIQSLNINGWIYRRPCSSSWAAYQDKINSGYMEHKTHVINANTDKEKIICQALITPKGLTRIALIFGVQVPSNDWIAGQQVAS